MKMKRTNLFLGLILVLTVSWSSSLLPAQVRTGSISGTVTDDTGAVLPGVEVTVIHLDTGQSRILVTGDAGRYVAGSLNLGNYEVRAELVGFQTAVRRGITVQVGQEALVDLSLSVGEISEEIVVTGEAPLINTTSATLSSIIDEKQLHDLPLNSRNLVELSLLSAGVVQARSASYSGQTTSPAAVKISMGGARIYMTGYLLDGVDITDSSRSSGVGGAAGSLFGVETVREFNVISNNYSAEYSRFAGGVISLVTKSGTNDFHGSAFWFHRNDNLDARNFFDQEVPPEFRRHQVGGTIGGPIQPDKSFFFFSYEGFREEQGVSHLGFTPTDAARQGDLDGDGINEITVDPVIQPFLDLYPRANGRDLGGGVGEYFSVGKEPVNEDFITARWDHIFSDADSLFARYTLTDGDRGLSGVLPHSGWLSDSFATYVTIEEKHIFSPNLINTARIGFQRTTWSQGNPADDPCGGDCAGSPLNISGIAGEGFGDLDVGGPISSIGNFLVGKNVTNMFSYADDLFLTRGNHSFKIGASANRYQNNDFFTGWPGGRYVFASLESFLEASPNQWRGKILGSESLRGARQWAIGFYLQDDWKVTPNLTLNLGVRYEAITTPYEVNGRQHTLGPDPLNVGQPTNAPPFFENPSKLNFAPRIGLAWDPFGDGRTSIRAGYGIFHDTILFYQYANSMRRNCPVNTTLFLFGPQPFPRPPVPDAPPSECILGSVSFQAIQFDANQPYMQQYNASIQRDLGSGINLTAAYVGSKGTHLMGHRNINVGLPTGTLDGRKFHGEGTARSNPNYSDITMWDWGYDSRYHGLSLSLQKRFADGLQFQSSYTWGKSLDTNTRGNSGDSQDGASEPADPYNVAANYGPSDHHVEHSFRFNWAYVLPFSGFSGASRTLLEGWQLQGIVSLNTGSSAQILLGGGPGLTDYDGNIFRGQERPDLAAGADPNPVIGDGRDPQRYFDVTAFAIPPKGVFGNVGRNTLIGPGVATVDFSLMKETGLGEDVTMQFRVEFFNIFNRANFKRGATGWLNAFSGVANADGSPVANGTIATAPTHNPTAGRLSETSTQARQIQLGLRFVF